MSVKSVFFECERPARLPEEPRSERCAVDFYCFVTRYGSVANELGQPETEEAGVRLIPECQALTASA